MRHVFRSSAISKDFTSDSKHQHYHTVLSSGMIILTLSNQWQQTTSSNFDKNSKNSRT